MKTINKKKEQWAMKKLKVILKINLKEKWR